MTSGGGNGDDRISDMTRAAADRARRRAKDEMPHPDRLAGLSAVPPSPDLSPAEIRRLAANAIAQAQQISFLLGRLAELVDEEGDP